MILLKLLLYWVRLLHNIHYKNVLVYIKHQPVRLSVSIIIFLSTSFHILEGCIIIVALIFIKTFTTWMYVNDVDPEAMM